MIHFSNDKNKKNSKKDNESNPSVSIEDDLFTAVVLKNFETVENQLKSKKVISYDGRVSNQITF